VYEQSHCKLFMLASLISFRVPVVNDPSTWLNALLLSPVVPSEDDANMIQELQRCERRFGFLFR